jgi:hypothetical protein
MLACVGFELLTCSELQFISRSRNTLAFLGSSLCCKSCRIGAEHNVVMMQRTPYARGNSLNWQTVKPTLRASMLIPHTCFRILPKNAGAGVSTSTSALKSRYQNERNIVFNRIQPSTLGCLCFTRKSCCVAFQRCTATTPFNTHELLCSYCSLAKNLKGHVGLVSVCYLSRSNPTPRGATTSQQTPERQPSHTEP